MVWGKTSDRAEQRKRGDALTAAYSNLYKVENPRPSWLLKETARVVVPGGRIGILHVAVPFAPPECRLVTVYGVSTGGGFRVRAFTIYERTQDGLFAR